MQFSSRLVFSLGAALGAVSAHATQPPDPVASDGYYNTAAGSYALYNESNGTLNAALGYESLYRNTSGSLNTALGGRWRAVPRRLAIRRSATEFCPPTTADTRIPPSAKRL